MYHFTQSLLLAGAITVSGAAASAATVTATYTGTVGQGFDLSDIFGYGPSSTLDGKAFTLIFYYDTTIGRTPSTPTEEQIHGGGQNYTEPDYMVSPVSNVQFIINNILVSFDFAGFSKIRAVDDGTQNYIQHLSGSIFDGEGYVSVTETSLNSSIGIDLTAPQEIIGSGILSPFGRIEENADPAAINLDQGSFRYSWGEAYGSLKVEHLSITVSSVPLPGALPLFLVGLLGFGALRRRAS